MYSTARSVEDETRKAELNGNPNPECGGHFSLLQMQIQQKSHFEFVKFSIRLCTVRYRDI